MALIRGLFGSFRARLVLAFTLVVAAALLLVLTSLPRLLDGYFAQQEQRNLDTRVKIMAVLVVRQLAQYQTLDTDAPRPLLLPGDPPRPSDVLFRALGDEADGYIHDLAPVVAQANVRIEIAAEPGAGGPVYSLLVPLGEEHAAPGQARERISSSERQGIPDLYYSQSPSGAPIRQVTVTLSEPFTYRAETLEAIVGVMTGAASVALVTAVVVSFLLAARLTDPVRRLTQTSRALADGKLDARVSVPSGGSPEVAELATAFNAMAERLQGSIEFISRDRDRSRDFLADVSHELRTPIAALRTFNELLQDGAAADPATRDEFLDQSRQQIERLDWLATNLLELSKLDSGLVALDLRPDDLRAVVEDAVQQALPAAERRGVALELELPSEPVRQRHDPPRVGQVLSNLIGNAIKFTPAGGRITVRLTPTTEGADVTVTDTGMGITPTELPRVFDRFYRGVRAHEARAAGSGLGLSIVRSIVEMHGGRVAIESTVGRGTEVTVTLPRDVSVSSPAAALRMNVDLRRLTSPPEAPQRLAREPSGERRE
jgi:signal transduction histidine kinase